MLSSRHRKSSKKYQIIITMNNTNEAVLFNKSFKKQNFKQKQCQDCLREGAHTKITNE